MQIEIAVKVDGRLVKTHVEQVNGTLEQMEETVHAMGKRVAREALQSVWRRLSSRAPFFERGRVPAA